MIRYSYKQTGFTLIESAIVIMILSFILIPLFHFMNEQEIQKKEYQSERKKERIVSAINQFFKVNKRYPCPVVLASASNVNNVNFGEEAANCPADAVGVTSGGLPVKSLELPWEYASNNYGWYYSYTVTADLASNPDSSGVIIINDGVNNFATNVHYVVVDPGKDGKGTRNIQGGAISPIACTGTADSVNCTSPRNEFRESPQADNVSPTASEYYDDTLMYSLASENNALWIVKQSGSTDGKLDIINRNDGMVGLGFSDALGNIDAVKPTEKLHVKGSKTGGELSAKINGTIKVDQNVKADRNVIADTNVTASGSALEGKVEATSFCYGGPC